MATQNVLAPIKFISIAFHLVAATMIFTTYPDNIKASYPSITSRSDSLYVQARVSVLFANSLTVAFLAAQLLILLFAGNLYRQKNNAVVTTLHLVGIIFYSQFTFALWNFYNLWYLFLVFSLLPFLIQLSTTISSSLKYRRWN